MASVTICAEPAAATAAYATAAAAYDQHDVRTAHVLLPL